MPNPKEFSSPEVMRTTRLAMQKVVSGPTHRVQMAVADLLKTDIFSGSGWERQYADRLARQVTRSLDSLALAGEIVKHKHYRTVTWYLPAKWAEVEARTSAQARASEASRKRWENIAWQLDQLGLAVTTDRSGAPVLTQAQWEALLLNHHDPKGCCCQHCPHNGHCRD